MRNSQYRVWFVLFDDRTEAIYDMEAYTLYYNSLSIKKEVVLKYLAGKDGSITLARKYRERKKKEKACYYCLIDISNGNMFFVIGNCSNSSGS